MVVVGAVAVVMVQCVLLLRVDVEGGFLDRVVLDGDLGGSFGGRPSDGRRELLPHLQGSNSNADSELSFHRTTESQEVGKDLLKAVQPLSTLSTERHIQSVLEQHARDEVIRIYASSFKG